MKHSSEFAMTRRGTRVLLLFSLFLATQAASASTATTTRPTTTTTRTTPTAVVAFAHDVLLSSAPKGRRSPASPFATAPRSLSRVGVGGGGGSELGAIKEATFGMGCFWKPSEELLKVNGVVDTVVGYTGNREDNSQQQQQQQQPPTYDSVCFSNKWVEGVRVTYDDDVIAYEELLNEFFLKQEPKYGSRQYASIIFVRDGEEEQSARQWMEENRSKIRSDGVTTMITSVEPVSDFYRAENYHQMYWQKTRPRIAVMISLLVASTGTFDFVIPQMYQSTVHTAANALVFAGLLYVLLERKLDTKVVKL